MSKYYKVQKTTVKSAGKEIKLLILKPTKNRRPREETPGILWIHGGGYITGMAEMVYISRAMALVKKFGVVVVALGRHWGIMRRFSWRVFAGCQENYMRRPALTGQAAPSSFVI